MPYIPSNKVEVKYSNGGLFTFGGRPYVGDYIIYNNIIYAGDTWTGNNQRLLTQQELQDPSRITSNLPIGLISVIPIPFRPRPTENDYTNGVFRRYFVKPRSNNLPIYEVSLSEYNRVLSDNNLNSTFKTEVIDWSLDLINLNETLLNRLESAGYLEIKNVLPSNDWIRLDLAFLDIRNVLPDTPDTCVQSSFNEIKNPRNIPNINSIIREAARRGLNKQNISALLAVAGGESAWHPRNEDYIYSEDIRLRQIFKGLSEEQYIRARQLVDNKDRIGFFNLVYGEYQPERVGNRNVEDGGIYYGRGFVQLTGHGNYLRYGRRLNIDLVNNPELVNDLRFAFKIVVEYYLDRVKVDSNDPNFINKVLNAFGNNTDDIKEKKINFYNCFMSILPG